HEEPRKLTPEQKVLEWLLRCFAFVRSRWVFTEQPMRCHPALFSSPEAQADFKKSLFAELDAGMQAYKARWVWELVIGGLLLSEPYDDVPPGPDQIEKLTKLCDAWWQQDSLTLACSMLDAVREGTKTPPESWPKKEDLEAYPDAVVAAFDREFLAFKLVPYA